MEVNANPSLNVYNDKELPNGDIEQTLSELDKYIKCNLVSDTLKIITMPQQQLDAQEKVGWFKKVLPSSKKSLEELYLYSYAEKIFEVLAGQRSYDFITNSQFQKLSKYPGLTNNLIVKGHYDLIYKNVIRRSDNSQMDLNCFFEALEELANRLFDYEDPYDNLYKLISLLKQYVSPPTHIQP